MKIGPHKMPVFQPGTVTLFSGVKRQCPLEVFAKNCGQNGPILGMSCALFLARFMTHLAYQYEQEIEERNLKKDVFDSQVYHNVLKQIVEEYCEEDANSHGRLIEIKKICMDFEGARLGLDEETNQKFNLNDVRVYQNKTQQIDKVGLKLMRDKYSYYSDWEKLFIEEDATKITQEILPKIRSELLQKKGIFSELY